MFNEILDFSSFKPLGISYYGSKKGIAKILFQKMHELHYQRHGKKAQYFCDCFGGGGSMSFSALQLGYKAIYNELRVDLCKLFEALKKEDLPFEFCTQEEFKEILKIPQEKRNLSQIAKNILFSFNLNSKNYANITKYKQVKKLFDLIKERGINNETRLKYEREIFGAAGDVGFTLNYFHLKELRERVDLKPLQIINDDYLKLCFDDFKPCEVMIYADIPYQDKQSKKTYKDIYHNDFDINEFIEWSKDLAKKGFAVFVSEYNSPSDDFKELLELKKWCFANINTIRYEKLYVLE